MIGSLGVLGLPLARQILDLVNAVDEAVEIVMFVVAPLSSVGFHALSILVLRSVKNFV